MVYKIISAGLMLVAVLMGLKQGYAMATGKPEMLMMFRNWGIGNSGLMINGVLTITASLLILFPRTFVWGNFLMAAGILLIICFHLLERDLKGVAVELPFLLLNLLIIYLQHPMQD